MSIKRILIANRGEIACRIIRTCRQLGIKTVAIASAVDAASLAMQMADYGVVMTGNAIQDGYLNIAQIIDIAKKYSVDAIHPGYGFLSENPDFAAAVRAAGLIFIGPSAEAIQKMGSKSEAKAIAEAAGVPIIRGYMEDDQTLPTLLNAAQEIGYPLLIKAIYGGGGKGMRRVDAAADFAAAYTACQREAMGAFGNAQVMLEKYVSDPRHIEVQVFADQHGHVLALSERDCSLQRRHQKIIEEAPAAGLSDDVRQRLAAAAIKIAKAVDYEGAGTVEFLVDRAENFYFLEMNTRLQVEHPVTEEVLGLDLVAWQILIASGHPLPLTQNDIVVTGHAIEVRLYAEDPTQGFLPSGGLLTAFQLPEGDDAADVRIEVGYQTGDVVSVFYDPMLAKIIVWGENRLAAYQRLSEVLQQIRVEGVKTNAAFLLSLVDASAVTHFFQDVGYIDRLMVEPFMTMPPPEKAYALTALWLLSQDCQDTRMSSAAVAQSPWHQRDGWRLNDHPFRTYHLVDMNGTRQTVRIRTLGTGHYAVDCADSSFYYQNVRCDGTQFWALDGGKLDGSTSVKATFHRADQIISIGIEGGRYLLAAVDLDHGISVDDSADSHLNAPMPGRVIRVMVQAGEEVDQGCPLLIIEAMKMEHTIRAPYKGMVESVDCNSGDFVEEGVALARMVAAA